MKERLMSFVFCALDAAVMKEGKNSCDHFVVNSHCVCGAGGNLGLEHWDLLRSYLFLWVLHRIQPRYVHRGFFRHVFKLHSFFSNPYACLRLSKIILLIQKGYRLIGMVPIAQTCPLHNCSHLGKAVVKPSKQLQKAQVCYIIQLPNLTFLLLDKSIH